MRRLRLQALTRRLVQLREQFEASVRENLAARQRLAQSLAKGTVGAEIRFEANWAAARVQRQEILAQQMAEWERRRGAQQIVFQQARQRRKILENLQDHQLGLHRQMEARRAQGQLDDLFLVRRAGVARS